MVEEYNVVENHHLYSGNYSIRWQYTKHTEHVSGVQFLRQLQ